MGDKLDLSYAENWLRETRKAVDDAGAPTAKLVAVVEAFRRWDGTKGRLQDALRVLEGRIEAQEAKAGGKEDSIKVQNSLRLMRLAVPGQKRSTTSNWAYAYRAIMRNEATTKKLERIGIHELANRSRPKPESTRPGKPRRRRR